MAKQSLLLEAQEAEATAAARQLQASEAQHSLQQAQAARAAGASPSPHKRRLLQHLQEQHAADVARVLTTSIFAAVMARQHAEAAAAQQGQQALSPGPVLDLPPGEHWLHDISGASTARTARTPLSGAALGRTGSGSRGCRITAAAEASGSPTPSARRRLLAEVGAAAAAGAAVGTAAAAARDGPVHTPAVGRGELSVAAEAGGWPEDPGLGASRAAAATAAAEAATAEVARLEGELEEAAAECERYVGALARASALSTMPACCTLMRCLCPMTLCLLSSHLCRMHTSLPPPLNRRGEARRECQEMVEELQSFAEAQKRELAEVGRRAGDTACVEQHC